MNKENVKSIIALQRINNNLLALIDSMKAQNDINLKLMLDRLLLNQIFFKKLKYKISPIFLIFPLHRYLIFFKNKNLIS